MADDSNVQVLERHCVSMINKAILALEQAEKYLRSAGVDQERLGRGAECSHLAKRVSDMLSREEFTKWPERNLRALAKSVCADAQTGPSIVITRQRTTHTNGWIKGVVGGHRFMAKVYDEPSEFGINGGRVSKLVISGTGKKSGTVIYSYDRGLDKHAAPFGLVDHLVAFLEKLPRIEE